MNILVVLEKAINVLRWQGYKKYDKWDREYCVYQFCSQVNIKSYVSMQEYL